MVLISLVHRGHPLELGLDLGDLTTHPDFLQSGQHAADVARQFLVVDDLDRLDPQLGDQAFGGGGPGLLADVIDPLCAAEGRRRAAGRGDSGPHRRVAGMGEALGGQRVEHRPGQRRVLQRRLKRLTLRPQRGVARVRPTGAGRRRRSNRPPPRAARGRSAAGLGADPAQHLGYIRPAHPAGQLAGVLVAQAGVLDLGDRRYAAPQRADPALGAVQVMLGQRGADGELEQRGPPRHQVAQRAVAGLEPQIAGVHAVGGHRDETLPGQVLLPGERLERSGLTGRVTVEDVDQLAAKELVVHHQSAQHRQVLVAEGGTAGGDRGGHPGQVHRHHVGVALDDDTLMALGDVTLGQIKPEQDGGLLVEHRLRGVDVLGGDRVVVEDSPRAESQRLATGAADGPQQPAVEAVDRAAPTLPGQPRRFEFLELEALADQVFGQRVPARGRKAATELSRRGGVEVSLGEVLAGRCGFLGFQCGGIEFDGCGIGGHQPTATAPIPLDAGAAAGVGQGVTDLVGQHLHRLDEADVLDLLHEGVDVTALAAAEAVEVPVIGPDVERRRLLVVEGAQPLE